MLALACSPGPIDLSPDPVEEAREICSVVCTLQHACDATPPTPSVEECQDICMGLEDIIDDSECGRAARAMTRCVAEQETCEDYFHAMMATPPDPCEAETKHFASLKCGAEP